MKTEERTFSLSQLNEKVLGFGLKLNSPKPVIGISTNHNHVDENTLTHTYCDSVQHAGGLPLIIPQTSNIEVLMESLGRCDALIMSGGADVHSLWWGEDPHNKVGKVDHNKDYYDLVLVQGALHFNLPILGICRGLQLLNISLGGTLYQDIPSLVEGAINHLQTATRYEEWHPVKVLPQGRLKEIMESDAVMVNSFHHQAVNRVAPCGTVAAVANDGVVEAVDFYPEYNALGVQWHPEALACEGKSKHLNLFKWLVAEASLYREARAVHQEIFSLDSHVDTPSILVGRPCDTNDTPKVDYSQMVVGGLDAVFMAAYVAQGSDAPYDQVVEMLDAVDDLVKQQPDAFCFCPNTLDALKLKKPHPKVLFKAVENGYAIGNDMAKLEELAKRGVRYITLCHNGDNLICDSALKSNNTHGGLSAWGREVVAKMNELGIAVDVSHAADSTVHDLLEVSTQPIIASHSSCKACYNHPRNLSDELIKAIANKGGVIQLCMYHGFLKEEGATVLDFVEHIMHTIELVGSEHVGIGTDFDGGGEVIGCRSAAAILRITIELLRRGVAIKQLRGLWGENLLRLMA